MVMASFTVTPSTISTSVLRLQSSSPSPISPLLSNYQHQLGGGGSCRRNRGSLVLTRGGPPGTSTYIFAFLFPLSLLAVTIFTAINISDKLDRDFYEELAVNQSILEAEDEEGDEDVVTPTNEEPPRPRTRNRPKREAEVSGR